MPRLDNINGTVYEWTVSWSGLNPSYHNVCYLAMTENALEGSSSFNTHYFNISDQPLSSSLSTTTSTSEPPSSSISISSLTSTSTSAAPTTTITQIATGTGLSGGAIAGASIGGTLSLVILCGFSWWIYRRFRPQDSAGGGAEQSTIGGTIEPNKNISRAKELHSNPLHEMQAREVVQLHELGGEQSRFREGHGS